MPIEIVFNMGFSEDFEILKFETNFPAEDFITFKKDFYLLGKYLAVNIEHLVAEEFAFLDIEDCHCNLNDFVAKNKKVELT